MISHNRGCEFRILLRFWTEKSPVSKNLGCLGRPPKLVESDIVAVPVCNNHLPVGIWHSIDGMDVLAVLHIDGQNRVACSLVALAVCDNHFAVDFWLSIDGMDVLVVWDIDCQGGCLLLALFCIILEERLMGVSVTWKLGWKLGSSHSSDHLGLRLAGVFDLGVGCHELRRLGLLPGTLV